MGLLAAEEEGSAGAEAEAGVVGNRSWEAGREGRGKLARLGEARDWQLSG